MFKTAGRISAVVFVSLLLFGCIDDGAPDGYVPSDNSGCNPDGPGGNKKSSPCDPREFSLDANTLALYHFNESSDFGSTLVDETGRWNGSLGGGTRSSGKYNGGLMYSQGQYSTFDTIIPDGVPNGTVEAYFAFNPGYDSTAAYAIFGNNGARCNLLYKNGTFIFQKNHSNIYKHVIGTASCTPGCWYHVAGTWGAKGMRLFLDCVEIASNQDYSVYQSSPRGVSENNFFIGWKAYDGMGGVGIYGTIYFNGKVDEIRISNVDRYDSSTVGRY